MQLGEGGEVLCTTAAVLLRITSSNEASMISSPLPSGWR